MAAPASGAISVDEPHPSLAREGWRWSENKAKQIKTILDQTYSAVMQT